MANKKMFLMLLISLFVLASAFAQIAETQSAEFMEKLSQRDVSSAGNSANNAEPENYYIDRSGDESRFIQRLLWEEAEDAFRYTVIVEQLNAAGRYKEVERADAEKAFAEFSLAAGKYRYCVEVYDLFDEFSFVTEWCEFDIILALQPEISSFSPQSFILDEDEIWEINLHGENLLPDSEFFLVYNNIRIIPRSCISEGGSSRLMFSGVSLVPGQYNIYVKNLGGLDDSAGIFSIGYKTPSDLNISAGYAPILPLYGFLFTDSEIEAPFSGSFYPIGVMARISYVPFKRMWGYMGAEFSGSFSSLKQVKELYIANGFLINTHVSFLYQKYFSRKTFALNATLGVGAVTLCNFHYEYNIGAPTENKTSIYPSFTGGLSFMAFFEKPFFLSAGLDFIQLISQSDDGPVSAFIRPYAAVGIQL